MALLKVQKYETTGYSFHRIVGNGYWQRCPFAGTDKCFYCCHSYIEIGCANIVFLHNIYAILHNKIQNDKTNNIIILLIIKCIVLFCFALCFSF